jgi:hypothetical protein
MRTDFSGWSLAEIRAYKERFKARLAEQRRRRRERERAKRQQEVA